MDGFGVVGMILNVVNESDEDNKRNSTSEIAHVSFITVFPSVEAVAGPHDVVVMTINYSRIGNFNESLRFSDAWT